MNRSTLLKLGALGTVLYFANKNKSANASQQQLDNNQQRLDKNQEKLDSQEKMTPFTFGKSLANKFFGKK